jgi:hypothetical protein
VTDPDYEPQKDPHWWSRFGWILMWIISIAVAAAGGTILAEAIFWWATR